MSRRKAQRISVLVVDDHTTFAEALSIALGFESDLEVRAVFDGLSALDAVTESRTDVVLMDLEMPGVRGNEATRLIKEVAPDTHVIALSIHDEDLERAAAVASGVAGFISKLSRVDEVADAIRRVHRGEALIDPEEMDRLLRQLRRRRNEESTERQRVKRLTPRQMEILQLMADGVSSRDIAQRLEMSPQTLRTHVQNILTRLGAHTKLEAVALAIRQGRVRPRGAFSE
jgi:DNA-binding NarL/FixJ family response regulator